MAREELATAGPREPENVLKVWSGCRQRPRHRRVERSTYEGEERHSGDPGADLEAAIPDVLVRQSIACQVQQEAERKRAAPRTDERAADRTRRNVKRDDQRRVLAEDPGASDPAKTPKWLAKH
jgi:hypothetical protein